MRHKLLVLTVKKFLQSVYIYGSYRKIKTGVPFFLDHPVYGAPKFFTGFCFNVRTKFEIRSFTRS